MATCHATYHPSPLPGDGIFTDGDAGRFVDRSKQRPLPHPAVPSVGWVWKKC